MMFVASTVCNTFDKHARALEYVNVIFPTQSDCICCNKLRHNYDNDVYVHTM